MNTAEILRAAAQRVRQGWCQDWLTRDGGVCALGAIIDAKEAEFVPFGSGYSFSSLSPELQHAARHFADAMKLPPGVGIVNTIARWNDAPGQTAENVAQGLEYAALLWEQEQKQTEPATSEVAK